MDIAYKTLILLNYIDFSKVLLLESNRKVVIR